MWALCWKLWTCALILWWTGLCSAATSVQACRCRCASGWMSDLQVWHIPALVLEMFSWCEHSISSPPSLCLSSAGLTQRGLSPAQITQLEMSNQRDQREEGAHFTDRLQVTGEDKGLCLKQGREHSGKHETWQLTPISRQQPWSYSPQPQLYATSSHPFWKV